MNFLIKNNLTKRMMIFSGWFPKLHLTLIELLSILINQVINSDLIGFALQLN